MIDDGDERRAKRSGGQRRRALGRLIRARRGDADRDRDQGDAGGTRRGSSTRACGSRSETSAERGSSYRRRSRSRAERGEREAGLEAGSRTGCIPANTRSALSSSAGQARQGHPGVAARPDLAANPRRRAPGAGGGGPSPRRHDRADRSREAVPMTGDAATTLEARSAAPERDGLARRFWDLVFVMALTDYRRRYAGSVLGYAWALLRPLMLFAVLYAVFTRVIRFGGSVPDYAVLATVQHHPLLLLPGGHQRATAGLRRARLDHAQPQGSGAGGAALGDPRRRVHLRRQPCDRDHLDPRLRDRADLDWLSVAGPARVPGGDHGAVGVCLSVLFVHFRDVGQAWQPIARLLFYASPVLFPFEYIPEGFSEVLAAFNPLSPLFVQARHWIIDPTAPPGPRRPATAFRPWSRSLTLGLCGSPCSAIGASAQIAERL